jgi:hypothetical protein
MMVVRFAPRDIVGEEDEVKSREPFHRPVNPFLGNGRVLVGELQIVGAPDVDGDEPRQRGPRESECFEDAIPILFEVFLRLPVAIEHDVQRTPLLLKRELLVSVSVFDDIHLVQTPVVFGIDEVGQIDGVVFGIAADGRDRELQSVAPGIRGSAGGLEEEIAHPPVGLGDHHINSTLSVRLPRTSRSLPSCGR